MASCNVQATPSQEELKRAENNKNVKNSEECQPMEDDVDAVVPSSSGSELRSRSSGVGPTKIPAPLFLGPSASSRSYTSLMPKGKRRSSMESHQMADDSGINLDCSTDEQQTTLSARPSPMLQPMLDRIPDTSSEMELRLAEEQTLKELQRVVAEMEADVALNNLDMQNLLPDDIDQDMQVPYNVTDVDQYTQFQNEASDVDNVAESSGLDMEKLTGKDIQQEIPLSEPEELPAGNVQMVEKEIAQKEEFPEIKETAVEIESLKEFEIVQHLDEEPVDKHPEIVQETPQDPTDGEFEKSVPESDMEELETIINESSESEEDRLVREQFEKYPETLEPMFHPLADEIVCIDSEPELADQPSLEGSVESGREMVTLDELFDPEYNVHLMRQLLQARIEEDSEIETVPDLIESEQAEEKETETEPEAEIEMEEEMDPDLKQTGKPLPLSFLRRIMNNRIIKLSCPILFCSLAFSLIYMMRKE
ncbi:uncharacterized protein LOC6731253 [Drosophila simulans]|uniref:GD22551 n=1 Tax=Drosophila simulans TaxID=7240 RepID=B4Q505_DROSI|nr:uncharacterized protein LOC6731253 [Drosophila simulans]EDX03997.1 GD22551 [Drosophila simulans]KMY88589.1 uncharacterized protein Dsimw501_GD22551 [Drosophila simulans]